jgi:catechol-2,3-dioxygenase
MTSPARTTGFAELVLVVDDVPGVAAFYRDVVGLSVMTEADDSWAWFWTGEPDASARLALHRGSLLFEEHSPHPAGYRWGQVHFALDIPREHLDAALEQARAAGVELYGPQRFEWMGATSWFLYDPAGNLVEFWSPDD